MRAAVTYPASENRYSDKQVAQALTDVGLKHLAADLDLDEKRVAGLSGGEQQRLALARALLSKPDWLFLDEATASLEPKAEAELYDTLKRLLPKTTVVSIAHREAVASWHDERWVLQPGENGKPGKLLVRNVKDRQ